MAVCHVASIPNVRDDKGICRGTTPISCRSVPEINAAIASRVIAVVKDKFDW